jgi:signal transduction histidine kinase/CheY-like chemotaxis protein
MQCHDATAAYLATHLLDSLTDRMVRDVQAPICGTDAQGRVNEWNAYLARVTGLLRQDVMGEPLGTTLSLVCPEQAQALEAALARALAGHPANKIHLTLPGPVHIQLRLSPCVGTDAVVAGTIGIGQDTTALRAITADRDRVKRDYLAFVCHEVRNPLQAITGALALLRDTAPTAEQSEYLQYIDDSSVVMSRVVGDVLTFSRLASSGVELESIPFVVEQLFDAEQWRLLLRDDTASFVVTVAPGVPRVLRGDPTRLRQLLFNLLSNGFKFLSPGGAVHLHVRYGTAGPTHVVSRPSTLLDSVTCLVISVQDTGCGMPPAVLAKCFRPYAQASVSTVRTHGGTGLGLAISREIVHAMGGYVSIQSVPGEGTCVTVVLEAEPAIAEPVLPDTVVPPPSPGRHYLVVDDCAINRKILTKMLEGAGHHVSQARHGREALEVLRQPRAVDCVLMDVRMPVMDGLEATEQIRRDPALAGIRVVGVTANATAGDREACRAAGMDTVVTKPVDLVSLLVASTK